MDRWRRSGLGDNLSLWKTAARGRARPNVSASALGISPTDTMNMPQQNWTGSATDFVRQALLDDPAADYESIKKRGEALGLLIPPIIYGRIRKTMPRPPAREAGEAPALGAPAESRDRSPAGGAEAARPVPDARQETKNIKKTKSPALDYALQELQKNPAAAYRDLKAHCDQQGWNLPPILFGRAKVLLGLVPTKPRKRKPTSPRPSPAAPAETRQPSRSPRALRQVASADAKAFQEKLADMQNLDQLIAAVRELDAERKRLRDLLERIVDMIDEELG